MKRRIVMLLIVCALATASVVHAGFTSRELPGATLTVLFPNALVAGGPPATITIRTTQVEQGIEFFTYALNGSPAFVIVPATQTTVISSGGFPDVVFQISAAPGTPPGAYLVPLTLAGGGRQGTPPNTLLAELPIRVTAPPVQLLPTITAVSPPSVISPTRSAVLRVGGTNFAPGGVVISNSPDIIVERTTVFSSTLAEVVVSVRGNAALGPRTLAFRNPDGATSQRFGTVTIFPAGSLGAPLGVSTAAIVFPTEGAIVGDDEAVYPRAVLAASGTGTISGRWTVDGATFDRFTAVASAGGTVEVKTNVPIPRSPRGRHLLALVVESPRVDAQPQIEFLSLPENVTRLTIYEPLDRAVVEGRPRIRWSLMPGASGYELEIVDVEEAGRESEVRSIRTTATQWRPEEAFRGTKRLRVRAIFPGEIRGEPTEWITAIFLAPSAALRNGRAASRGIRRVASLAAPESGDDLSFGMDDQAATPDVTPTSPPATYVFEPTGTVKWLHAPPNDEATTETLTLGSQGSKGDVTAGTGVALNGTLNYDGSVQPTHLAQTSNSWIAEGRKQFGSAFGSARFGYSPPDVSDGAEYLSTGLSRPAATIRAGNAHGVFSYYEPVDPNVHGVVSATAQDARVRVLAFATPEGRDYVLRAIGLSFEEPVGSLKTPGGSTTRTFGLFGRYTFGSWAQATAEVAHGSVTYGPTAGLASARGNAARLRLEGVAAATTYSIGISNVDPRYPVSGTLSSGIEDRFVTDLSLSRPFRKATLKLSAKRTEQGRDDHSLLPRSNATTASFGMDAPLGPRVVFSASVEPTYIKTVGATSSPLDSRFWSARSSLTEAFTKLTFSQSIEWSHMDDRVTTSNRTTFAGSTLSASGKPFEQLTLSSSAGFNRTRGDALAGTTDRWLASITPTITVPRFLLTFSPSISLDGESNDVTNARKRNETYRAFVDWTPPWWKALFSGQVGGTLTRAISRGAVPSTTNTRSVEASVTIHLKKERGLPMFADAPR